MFDSTIPFGEPELMRASSYRQYLPGQLGGYSNSVMSESLATLSPSLVADLRRVEFDQRRFEPLDVLTACLRHAQAVTVHLQCGDRAVPLTVFPRERQLLSSVAQKRYSASVTEKLNAAEKNASALTKDMTPEQAYLAAIETARKAYGVN